MLSFIVLVNKLSNRSSRLEGDEVVNREYSFDEGFCWYYGLGVWKCEKGGGY